VTLVTLFSKARSMVKKYIHQKICFLNRERSKKKRHMRHPTPPDG